MAYNSYFPVTYQPVGQNYYQPYSQQATPPQPNIIWISGGEKEASMYPVAPNNAVTLWSTSEPVVYLKQADASGKPTMKTYDLVERVETSSVAHSASDVKMDVYATKDDLGRVSAEVKGIDSLVSALKSDIETIKGDMYGIAGKKKPVKKGVDEDE